MEKTLFIAVPTLGHMSTGTALWLTRTAQQNPSADITVSTDISPVARARNTIFQAFLKSEHAYFMTVDSDTLPSTNAIERLMKLIDEGASVATGITPIKHKEGRSFNVYRKYTDVEKFQPFTDLPKEPFEVVGCGLSCAIITREIIEKLSMPYCKTIEFDDGNFCSEDLYFCEMVTKAGGKIMADPAVVCGHVKEFII